MKLNNRLWSIVGLLLASFLTIHTVFAETVYRVRYSDTLTGIVSQFYARSGYPRSQVMVAILAKNPDAFNGGNINYLLKGKRLVLPTNDEINQISRDEAQQLIAHHTKLFRMGIKGVGNTPIISIDSQSTVIKVKKQTEKISKLELESSKLKKQLEQLFLEKKQRDEELLALEEQIKQYSAEGASGANGASPTGTAAEIEKKNQTLKEKNDLLQKKLIESKSELAENARSTMTLERKLNNLRERMDEGVAATPSNVQQSQIATSLMDKFYWLIPLLLLAAVAFLLWYLLRWFLTRRRQKAALAENEIDYEKDYATLINENESTDYLNPENIEEEAPLETSIKLDVARAYLEADDVESAVNILEEIIAEGSDKQQREAREILSSI